MDTERLLTLLRGYLSLLTTYMDEDAIAAQTEQLTAFLEAAEDFITTEGITLHCSQDDWIAGDAHLVVMYAGWLYARRFEASYYATSNTRPQQMPRMLRWALNNRVFAEKAKVE